MIRGLLLSVVVAAFIVVLFAPAKTILLRWVGPRPRLVAFVLTVAALVLIVLPTAAVLYLIVGQVLSSLVDLKAELGAQGTAKLMDGHFPPALLRIVHALQQVIPVPTGVLEEQFSELAQKLPAAFGKVVRVSLESIVGFLFISFGTFYLFLDGERLVRFLRDVSPLRPAHSRALWKEFGGVARAMLFGSVISVASGALICVLGFWLLGVPKFLFWGVMTGLFTMAPGIGSALVFVPLAALLAIQGHMLQAVGVLAFCTLALVVVNDTLLRPLIVGHQLRLHPYLILLSIFGGVEAYGIPGLLVGPMAATLMVAALRLYRRDVVSTRGVESESSADEKPGRASIERRRLEAVKS